ncbi:hypothetical protein FJY68_02615 [candidate division WOR-3 bacterium]|uniref:Bulb-type lectin domain-containing protein n=1 Tax=candidate division WOR-3 bacterium TaxID=2052148 RepID=A0A937XG02_UNCW3|nr:hypothetical protein [candidate division WOR-3 bacterium]
MARRPRRTIDCTCRRKEMKETVFAFGLAAALFAGCLASVASAQSSWWKTYGDSLSDIGNAVLQTAEGGYVIGGSTASFGAGVTDVYLVKTNATGEEVWAEVWGDSMPDGGNSVCQIADSGYVVAGYTGSYGAGGHDVWLIRTDAEGDTVWTRTYGGGNGEQGNSVAPTADGGYIVTGYTWSFGAGVADVYLIKTNAAGDTDWTRTYGGTSGDEGLSVQQTVDGGYIVAGVTHSIGAGIADVYLIKTNAAGDTDWTRTYGGTSNDEGHSVRQTADSGYIIAGYTSSFGAGSQDLYLIKTNASGDTVWTRTFGGNLRDWGNSVQPMAGGGYVIAGVTRSFGAGGQDLYLIRTDASGDTVWTRTFGGTGNDAGNSVQSTGDGGWVIAGSTTSFGAGNSDVYLIKTDADGFVGLAEKSLQPQVRSRRFEPTVVGSLPRGAIAFDAMGRRVLHPIPGIYFVREEPQASGHGPQAARRVAVKR